MTRRTMRPDAGLTITELMVVLVIALLTSVLAGQALSRTDNARAARTYARQVLVAMRQARTSAIETGCLMRIVFRPDGKAVTILSASLPGDPPPAGVVWAQLDYLQSSLAEVRAVETTNIESAACTTTMTSPQVLEFRPDGSAGVVGAGSGGAAVCVRDLSDTHRHRLVLYGMTGFSTLQAGW